jgi:hypothetical protein
MMRFFKDLFRPTEFANYELVIMRLLFAWVVWDTLPLAVTLSEQPVPVGLGRWFDFGFFSDPTFYSICRVVMVAALALYVIGRWLWIALPVAFFIVVGPGTLEASQGANQHATNLVALILLVQMIWYVVAKIRKTPTHEGHVLGAFYAQQTIAAGYVVSALSKIMADGNWLIGAMKNYPLQMIKTARQNHFNTLEPAKEAARDGFLGWLAQWVQPLFAPMEQALMHSAMWRGLLLGSGFLLELLAFVALVGRKSAALMGVSIIFFHFAIYMVMGLKFQYHMAVVAIFFVGVPYWIVKAVHFKRAI